MGGNQNLRALAAVLALASAVLHMVLFLWDLIPGQPTAGAPPFLIMTVLYAGVAAVAWFEVRRLYLWSAAYTAATIVGYFATRLALGYPLEAWGLSDKVIELALVAYLVALWRAGSRHPAAQQAVS